MQSYDDQLEEAKKVAKQRTRDMVQYMYRGWEPKDFQMLMLNTAIKELEDAKKDLNKPGKPSFFDSEVIEEP